MTKISRNLPNNQWWAAKNADNPHSDNPFVTEALTDDLQLQIDSITGGGNVLLSGGVTWAGPGFEFDVSNLIYRIQGTTYDTGPGDLNTDPNQVTLAAADPTLDRIDVIFVDTAGVVGVKTGVPATEPIKPTVDGDTELEVTFITVAAGTTSPGITITQIYDENTEWSTSTNGPSASFDPDSTVEVYQGAKSIEIDDGDDNDFIEFNNLGPFVVPDSGNLVFRVWQDHNIFWAIEDGGGLVIKFFNGVTLVGSSVIIENDGYGFSEHAHGVWQTVIIPLADFGGITGQTIDNIRISVGVRPGMMGMMGSPGIIENAYLDDIYIEDTPIVVTPPNSDHVTGHNVIHVALENGDDATGERGNWGKPYATFPAANNDAQSGDVIVSFGDFIGNNHGGVMNLVQHDVNYIFNGSVDCQHPGATAFIDDTVANGQGGAVVSTVIVNGDISVLRADGGSAATVVRLEDAGSDITLYCNKMSSLINGVHRDQIIDVSAGTLNVIAKESIGKINITGGNVDIDAKVTANVHASNGTDQLPSIIVDNATVRFRKEVTSHRPVPDSGTLPAADSSISITNNAHVTFDDTVLMFGQDYYGLWVDGATCITHKKVTNIDATAGNNHYGALCCDNIVAPNRVEAFGGLESDNYHGFYTENGNCKNVHLHGRIESTDAVNSGEAISLDDNGDNIIALYSCTIIGGEPGADALYGEVGDEFICHGQNVANRPVNSDPVYAVSNIIVDSNVK